MTAPALDERDHFDAIKAALPAALDGHVYRGEVPGDTKGTDPAGELPDWWVQVHIERRYVESSASGRTSRSGWRVILRAVDNLPGNVLNTVSQVAAIEGTRLTIDGTESTPLVYDPPTDGDLKHDDGRFSAATGCTYAL